MQQVSHYITPVYMAPETDRNYEYHAYLDSNEQEGIVRALSILCENYSRLDPPETNFQLILHRIYRWQDEINHPMIRWEMALQM